MSLAHQQLLQQSAARFNFPKLTHPLQQTVVASEGVSAMRKDTKQQFRWSGRLETLEDRLVMSATPLAALFGGSVELHASQDDLPTIDHHVVSSPDFWIDHNDQELLAGYLDQIEQNIAWAHNQSGVNTIHNNYGFAGTGQTVVVIDSGIAYDHFALGGGFGAGYRVVGGWDFAENNSDPYDDGPAGSHGTHVAGIIGSSDATHKGIAPGVDLVGLRVFDDSGAGYFSWVEQALQWTINNLHTFDNPITTVNLSLGSSWNSATVPSWAMLEDEFATLKANGVFISVSAGNSFTAYDEPGLSYPAASPFVVPVMASNSQGDLAAWSQRLSRAIAAPGVSLASTVPDYIGSGTGFATYSGTSMAAPYVAGSSVLIREAMEFVGYIDIDQDTIYNHMVEYADQFYDSATSQFFNRLNLGAAIDALMPEDDYGSTVEMAHQITNFDSTLHGTINTLDDIDCFKFTAANTGTVTFSASNLTHDLVASWSLDGGTGTVSGDLGDIFTFDVVAGTEYAVGLSTSAGIGHYELDIELTSAFTFVDWGAVSFNQRSDVSVDGEGWYRIVASRNGYLTVESMFGSPDGQLNMELYDSNLEPVSVGTANEGTSRVNFYATAGEEYFLNVLGTNESADFTLANLVSIDGTTVNISGTSGNDAFSFTAGAAHSVSVNGVTYALDAATITNINFNGGAGTDSITMTGTNLADSVLIWSSYASMTSSGYSVVAANIQNTTIDGGGGNDTAKLFDTAGDDVYTARVNDVEMKGNGYLNRLLNFQTTHAYASTGSDQAFMYDSAGVDEYSIYPDRVVMKGTGYLNRAINFGVTTAYSLQGNDTVFLFDSPGDDLFVARPDQVTISGNGFEHAAHDFYRANAIASQGFDRAELYDSAGNDYFSARKTQAAMYATDYSYLNKAFGFDQTQGYASSGYDWAFLYDSDGDDLFVSHPLQSSMSGSGFENIATGFDRVDAYASSGFNTAILYGSSSNDSYRARNDQVKLFGTNYLTLANSFDHTTFYGVGGTNDAVFYDSSGNEHLLIRDWGVDITAEGYRHELRDISALIAYSTKGGIDTADVEAVDYLFSLIGAWTV